jgi:dynein intermediate chain 1
MESEEARDYLETLEKVETAPAGPAVLATAKKEAPEVEEVKDEPETLKNQFNFSDRATQTFTNPSRNKEVCTEPPPTSEFCEQVSLHIIHDAYLEDIERKIVAAAINEKNKKRRGADEEEEEEEEVAVVQTDLFLDEAFASAMKMMERMIVNNSEAAVFEEYKANERSRDKDKDDAKSFVPLWKFNHAPPGVNPESVTSIAWNPAYTDLFAVGYGSYDFIKQGGGMICCYTLKNTSHPEYVYQTDKGVMSIDFNKDHPSLLCVGMYDGSVAVYDLKEKSQQPIFSSDSPKTKHTDPVWQVYWGKEGSDGLNFYSISSDGHVLNWALSKTELARTDLVALTLNNEPGVEDMDSSILGLAGGSCFDFNANNEHLFVVGTEEGAIKTYSKQFNAEFLRSFQGHHMAVYSVHWNTFHPGVFLSCSADWTVKLWEVNNPTPIMTFDLNTSIGDVAWSPFSSTVFATITYDGMVRLYDLSVDKHEPIAKENLNRTARGTKDKDKLKLTKISFNPTEPILCVGDDKGIVSVLKLSNMKITPVEEMDIEAEVARLDALMIMPAADNSDDVAALLEAAAKGITSV